MSQNVLKEKNSELEYLKIDHSSDSVIILFHGYGASMYDLYGIGDVIPNGKKYDWIFPNGFVPLQMGFMMMSRAWFPIDVEALEQAMQTGTFRDFSDLYTDEFKEALRRCQQFLDALSVNYKKIILGGFSQGAMISTHLSLQNSDRVEKLLCLSGAYIGKKELQSLLETSTKFEFFQSHGKQDPILPYSGAKSLYELLKLGGHRGEFVGFDGVHEIPMVVLNKLDKFLD